MKRRRRHRNNKNTRPDGVPATSVEDVSDDLLKLILLRLDSPICLIRAASTCKRWRGVVVAGDGGGDFLRRARSLHQPTIVGHYHTPVHWISPIKFIPTSPQVSIADNWFSLSRFVPLGDTSQWKVTNVHANLVLLFRRRYPLDLIVCDPLRHRFQRASCARGQRYSCIVKDAFLIDGEDGNISTSNFRVLCRFYNGRRTRLLSYTNGSEEWRLVSVASGVNHDMVSIGHVAGRVDGSLYMGLPSGGLIVLDKANLEFSMVDLQHAKTEHGLSQFLVVPCAGDDSTSPRIVHSSGEVLEVFRRVPNGSAGEWVLERSIRQLSEATRGLTSYPEKRCMVGDIVTEGIGSVLVVVYDISRRRSWCFSVSLNNGGAWIELQKVEASSFLLDATVA